MVGLAICFGVMEERAKFGLVEMREVLSLQSHDYSTGEQRCALLN